MGEFEVRGWLYRPAEAQGDFNGQQNLRWRTEARYGCVSQLKLTVALYASLVLGCLYRSAEVQEVFTDQLRFRRSLQTS